MLKNIFNKIKNMNAEKTITSLLMFLFLLLIFGQILMNFGQLRYHFTSIETFEGHSIKEIDNLINIGTVELQLIGMSNDNDIKILVNGKVVSVFDKKYVKVNVKDGSIIEIDGTEIDSSFSVKINDVSRNIDKNILGNEVKVQSNIKYLTRITLKLNN